MKKPLTLVYGADEAPRLGVTLACGVRHAALISIRLLFPLLVAREAGLPPERVLDVLAISMLVMSLAVYLQTRSLEVAASFDEFTLDLRVSYAGAPLELPARRPTNEEILASEEGQRRLAGFMLRRFADQVQTTHRAGRCTVLFHFDH